VARLKPEVEVVNQKAAYGELTTFELLTALAFAYFELKKADFQVLEVGLGGEFDATNVVQPEVCTITSISLDHTEVLGNSLTQIAREKSGIIKSGSAVVLSPQPDEVTGVIEEVSISQKAQLVMVGKDVTWQSLSADYERQLLKVKGRQGSYKLSIPLLGHYQLENAATAVATLEILADKGFNVSPESIINGLARVNWPGRFQILSHHPLLVVDGAHNPDSARKLRQSLSDYFNFEQAILIIGVSSDKNLAGVVSALVPLFGEVFVTRSHHPRAMEITQLVTEFRKYGVKTHPVETVPEALTLALNAAKAQDLICVSGSLFVIAEALETFGRRGNLSRGVQREAPNSS
jgi:dihydrofolate synthase/folylpolyglutamate synthase